MYFKKLRHLLWIMPFLGISFSLPAQNTSDTFAFCEDGRVYDYFRTGADYKPGRKALKAIFTQDFSFPPGNNTYNGYIVLHFGINCRGEIGGFHAYGMDFQYTRQEAPASYVAALQKKIKSLKDWESGRYTGGEAANSRIFFIFKIKDNQIVEVLP